MSANKPFEKKYENKTIVIIGVLAIVFIAPFIFQEYNSCIYSRDTIFGVLGSLSTTLIMWFGVKSIVIYLWQKFPWETNPVKHLILEVLSILFYTALVGSIFFIVNKVYPIHSFDESMRLSIFFTLTVTFFITSIYEGYFFFVNWKETRILSEKLAKENIQSQYETLKSQLNHYGLKIHRFLKQ